MIIVLVILSLICENIFNLYINHYQYFIPLFTLMSLIFIYEYFKKDIKKYFITSFIIGFVYDIFFTNFYVLNSVLFLICSLFIYIIFSKFKNENIITTILCSLTTIIIYNIMIYFVLNFFNYTNYSLVEFISILKSFFILNIFYVIILYFIFNFKHIIKN